MVSAICVLLCIVSLLLVILSILLVKESLHSKGALKNSKSMPTRKKVFTTKKLVGIAMFSALAYVVSYLEFPIFPATSFLKLDFSSVFVTLSGFIFGPVSGIMTTGIKELICFLTKSSTGGVGEVANFIVTVGFILIPTTVYYFKKGFKTVIITLFLGCIMHVGLSVLMNRFVSFPLFMGAGAESAFNELWIYIVFFNLIKSVVVCTFTIILYKRVSKLINKISFTKRHNQDII